MNCPQKVLEKQKLVLWFYLKLNVFPHSLINKIILLNLLQHTVH